MDGVTVRGITIPESELAWSFDTPGGPGGQHANRNATRATLAFDLTASQAVPDDVKALLADRLGGALRDGVVTVTADDSRSQWRNRSIARDRLSKLLEEALRPRRSRRPTAPSRSARRRRLAEKRRRAEIKRMRQAPDDRE